MFHNKDDCDLRILVAVFLRAGPYLCFSGPL